MAAQESAGDRALTARTSGWTIGRGPCGVVGGLRAAAVCGLALGIVASGGAGQNPAAPAGTPAVVVRMDIVPGGTQGWIELFEAHMAPAIRDAIEAREEIVDFEYFEGLVASESTDVILVLRARTFAFFDERRPYPHYRALYRRLGPEEASRVLEEMALLERSVEVTLVRSFRDTGGGS